MSPEVQLSGLHNCFFCRCWSQSQHSAETAVSSPRPMPCSGKDPGCFPSSPTLGCRSFSSQPVCRHLPLLSVTSVATSDQVFPQLFSLQRHRVAFSKLKRLQPIFVFVYIFISFHLVAYLIFSFSFPFIHFARKSVEIHNHGCCWDSSLLHGQSLTFNS